MQKCLTKPANVEIKLDVRHRGCKITVRESSIFKIFLYMDDNLLAKCHFNMIDHISVSYFDCFMRAVAFRGTKMNKR